MYPLQLSCIPPHFGKQCYSGKSKAFGFSYTQETSLTWIEHVSRITYLNSKQKIYAFSPVGGVGGETTKKLPLFSLWIKKREGHLFLQHGFVNHKINFYYIVHKGIFHLKGQDIRVKAKILFDPPLPITYLGKSELGIQTVSFQTSFSAAGHWNLFHLVSIHTAPRFPSMSWSSKSSSLLQGAL